MDIKTVLSHVCELAVKVGAFQWEQSKSFNRDCVKSKRSHDYVSYVDQESERRLVDGLRQILPEATFITEEKTTDQTSGTTEYIWVVDPLDGTTNYIHNMSPWSVCIALKQNDELIMGVVYEVVRQELFYAIKGEGAWLKTSDGKVTQLQVSSIDDIDQALIMVGFPYNADEFKDFCVAMCDRLYGKCASLRSLGSAEAELCYVAAGRIDVYFESYLQPWDVSAGAIIVKEAGGIVSDYSGKDALWKNGRQVLATNKCLHESILAEMNKVNAEG